jgi:hypothetical protein
MIFGFKIITGLPEDLAYKILANLDMKLSRHIFELPADNSIRSVMVNYSFNQYFLWLSINAGVLCGGRETYDIKFVREPDFFALDARFKTHLVEIFGENISDRLPPLKDWGLYTMIYAMDIKIEHIAETMRIFSKTDMPSARLNPKNATGMTKPYESAHRGKLEIYPKLELIRSSKIDYKGPIDCSEEENRDIIRLLMINRRSNMAYEKRFLKKFEMDLWSLESFLNPLVVPNVIIKAYLDAIGGGGFYKYESAAEIVENKVANFQNRQTLHELLKNIAEVGTVAKARAAAGDKTKFARDLKLLRDAGINGALLDKRLKVDQIKNPLGDILEKGSLYSQF